MLTLVICSVTSTVFRTAHTFIISTVPQNCRHTPASNRFVVALNSHTHAHTLGLIVWHRLCACVCVRVCVRALMLCLMKELSWNHQESDPSCSPALCRSLTLSLPFSVFLNKFSDLFSRTDCGPARPTYCNFNSF